MPAVWTLLLLGLLALGSYWFARHGFRQPLRPARILAAAVLGWSWITLGMEVLGTLGALDRVGLLAWVCGWALAGLILRTLVRRRPVAEPGDAGRLEWSAIVAVGCALWAAAILGPTSLFWPVKVVSDGPIYHLYFAARWWKAGRLVLVAAPFGENAATYFPAVGDLWFCWLMIAWGGELLAKVGQAPFLVLAGLTCHTLCRRLGADRSSALIAACWFVTSTPLILFSFEPNVDTIFIAGYLLAVYFFLLHGLGDQGFSALVLAGLAAGLSLGTKATGIVFVPPLLVLASAFAIKRNKSPALAVSNLAAIWLLPLSVSGFWFGRNAVLTGNPLYPLHLSAFGRVWLGGWYGPESMRLSPYYLSPWDWRSLLDQILAVVDPRLAPIWLAALLGAWSWGRIGRSPLDRWVWMVSGLAVLNIGLYWLVIPYRTQQRFMFHALGLAAVPLARLFARSPWLRWLGAVLVAIHVATPQWWPIGSGEPPWDLTRRIPNAVPGIVPIPLDLEQIRSVLGSPALLRSVSATLGIGLLAVAAAWLGLRATERPSRKRWAWAALAVALLVGGACAPRYPWGLDPRRRFFATFPEYIRGWIELDLRSGPNGARVAYAGNDLPYYLLGVGLRNEVRYVNIDAHRDWLPHDYHLEAGRSGRATWDHPRPGWDRVHPDYPSWLANLRAEGIQLLVTTRVNPSEGPHNVADAAGFPIERAWADAHPEVFEPVYGERENDPQFRLYRVRPEHSGGG